MSAAASLVTTLFEAVWAFEAAEEERTGVRPATLVRVDTLCRNTRVRVGVCFEVPADNLTVDMIVEESHPFAPKAIRKAIESFEAWRDLTDRLEASKTVNAALRRGAMR